MYYRGPVQETSAWRQARQIFPCILVVDLTIFFQILLRLECKPEAIHGGAAWSTAEGEPGQNYLRQRGQHQLHPAARIQKTLRTVSNHVYAICNVFAIKAIKCYEQLICKKFFLQESIGAM